MGVELEVADKLHGNFQTNVRVRRSNWEVTIKLIRMTLLAEQCVIIDVNEMGNGFNVDGMGT
jgi:hypothetical protein